MARKESGSKTFESALGDLQQVVEQLETGELSLEDSLDAFEKGEFEVADQRLAFIGENQTIAAGPPEDRDKASDPQALSKNGEHILFADEPAVKQGQPRQCHKQNEGRARHHPAPAQLATESG